MQSTKLWSTFQIAKNLRHYKKEKEIYEVLFMISPDDSARRKISFLISLKSLKKKSANS